MIWLIFGLHHPTPDGLVMEATYILVREFLQLTDKVVQSQYTQFGFAGGFLCHNKKWNRFHVIELNDIICHFVKTMVQNFDNNVMHILPLNKVKCLFLMHALPLIVIQDDGILRSPFRRRVIL